MFEGAKRSRRAIDAAKAEQRRQPQGETSPKPPAGPLVPMRAEAAAALTVYAVLAVAILARVLLTDDASGWPSLALTAGAAAFALGLVLLAWRERRRRQSPRAAPLDAIYMSPQTAFLRTAGKRTMGFGFGVLVALGMPVDPVILWVFAFLAATTAAASLIEFTDINAVQRDADTLLYVDSKRRARGPLAVYTLD